MVHTAYDHKRRELHLCCEKEYMKRLTLSGVAASAAQTSIPSKAFVILKFAWFTSTKADILNREGRTV